MEASAHAPFRVGVPDEEVVDLQMAGRRVQRGALTSENSVLLRRLVNRA
jgi:hypothetical protein